MNLVVVVSVTETVLMLATNRGFWGLQLTDCTGVCRSGDAMRDCVRLRSAQARTDNEGAGVVEPSLVLQRRLTTFGWTWAQAAGSHQISCPFCSLRRHHSTWSPPQWLRQ